ncbi:MAG TPA: hypothetical protein VIP70_05670 [Nitrososphaeraceae archaeon]
MYKSTNSDGVSEDKKDMSSNPLFDRSTHPFGQSWERWAVIWYKWLISIPKKENPCLDETGKYCSVNQNNKNVWFLAGTFGNIIPVKRKCTIPSRKAILLPLLVKEDSFAEDLDLKTEAELVTRARDAMDRVLYMEATIDGEKVEHLEKYRVESEVFDLTFPEDNTYDVRPGVTRSVCNGFWLFIKPLEKGKHLLYFRGENVLAEPFTKNQMAKIEAYAPIKGHIDTNSTFKLEVLYNLTITNVD